MQRIRKNRERCAAGPLTSTMDKRDIAERYLENLRSSQFRPTAKPVNSTTAWQTRTKVSPIAVPARRYGHQQFAERLNRCDRPDESVTDGRRRCDLPVTPKRGQSTARTTPYGRDYDGSELDEEEASVAEAQYLRTLRQLDREQRLLELKTQAMFEAERKYSEDEERQPRVNDCCALTQPQSSYRQGGRKATVPEAHRQHWADRHQNPSTTSSVDYSSAEELNALYRSVPEADRHQNPSTTSSVDCSSAEEQNALHRLAPEADRLQWTDRRQNPSMTSSTDCNSAEELNALYRPVPEADRQQWTGRLQNPSMTSSTDCSSAEELNALYRPVPEEDRQQWTGRHQNVSTTSSTDCSKADGSSDEKRLQLSTELDRLKTTEDGQQCPCRIRYPSSTSFAESSRAEDVSDENSSLQSSTELDRLETTEDRQQCPCRIRYPSSTSFAESSRAEDVSDENSSLQSSTELDRPAATADRQECPCRIRYPSSTSFAESSRAEDVSDEKSSLQSSTELDRPAATADRQQCPCRIRYPSSTSFAESSRAEDVSDENSSLQSSTELDRPAATVDRQQCPCRLRYPSVTDFSSAEDGNDGLRTAFGRPAVAENKQQMCILQYPSSTSSADYTYAEDRHDEQQSLSSRTMDRPVVTVNRHQRPRRFQYPSPTSSVDHTCAEDRSDDQQSLSSRTMDRPVVTVDRHQRPRRFQYPSPTSSADHTCAEDRSDDQQSLSSRTMDRPVVTVDRHKRPCRFHYPSPTSSADNTYAEDRYDGQQSRLPRASHRPTATVDREQRPCRFHYPSPTSSADNTYAEDRYDGQQSRLPRASHRPTAAMDREQRPCRFHYPSPTSSADCIHAGNSSDEQLLQPCSTDGGSTTDGCVESDVPDVRPTSRSSSRSIVYHSDYDYCTAEEATFLPRRRAIAENGGTTFRRKPSSRKVVNTNHRKSGAFLDVPPGDNKKPAEPEDPENSYRLRSFSFTSKGIVNRGDSFRRRRSRSNSLAREDDAAAKEFTPPIPYSNYHHRNENDNHHQQQQQQQQHAPQNGCDDIAAHTVSLLGSRGVGKTALISQFMTSEYINAYEKQRDNYCESSVQSVCIMLNGEESELRFINEGEVSIKEDRPAKPADAFLVIFSVVDKNSFETAELILKNLREHEMLRSRPAILVGNKVDMARSRKVSAQEGRYLACTCRAKYIEVSVGINHNVDELLVGILTQIRLKRADGGEEHDHWYRNRNFIKASLKARQMFTWVFGKEDTKLKNCENLHIL